MRSHNDEHSDTLPVLDISALKHIAYVLDALVYYMRSGGENSTDIPLIPLHPHSHLNPQPHPSSSHSLHPTHHQPHPHHGQQPPEHGDIVEPSIRTTAEQPPVHSIWHDPDDNLNDDPAAADDDANVTTGQPPMDTDSIDGDNEVAARSGRRHPFFQRSDSTTFLGCPPPDPFKIPLVEAVPLADQPHLLQPTSRREELFGMPRQTFQESSLAGQPPPFDHLPTHLSLSMRSDTSSQLQDVIAAPTPAELASSNAMAVSAAAAANAGVIVRPQPSSSTSPAAATIPSTVSAASSGVPQVFPGGSSMTSPAAASVPLPATQRLVSMATNIEVDSPASPPSEAAMIGGSSSRTIPMETDAAAANSSSNALPPVSAPAPMAPLTQPGVIVHAGAAASTSTTPATASNPAAVMMSKEEEEAVNMNTVHNVEAEPSMDAATGVQAEQQQPDAPERLVLFFWHVCS